MKYHHQVIMCMCFDTKMNHDYTQKHTKQNLNCNQKHTRIVYISRLFHRKFEYNLMYHHQVIMCIHFDTKMNLNYNQKHTNSVNIGHLFHNVIVCNMKYRRQVIMCMCFDTKQNLNYSHSHTKIVNISRLFHKKIVYNLKYHHYPINYIEFYTKHHYPNLFHSEQLEQLIHLLYILTYQINHYEVLVDNLLCYLLRHLDYNERHHQLTNDLNLTMCVFQGCRHHSNRKLHHHRYIMHHKKLLKM